MVDYKEIVIYVIIAVVVIAVALFILKGGFITSTPNLSVTLSNYGNATYPYQTSHFIINVTNEGTSPVSNLLFGFYLNGVQISTNTITLPSKESVLLIRNYTYQEPGNFYFQAIADPGHLLSVKNRTSLQSSITINISAPENANIYNALPVNNINNTQSFTVTGTGAADAAEIRSKYDIAQFGYIIGPGGSVPLRMYADLFGYIAKANGAYIQYNNKSVAYTSWLQGTVDPAAVKIIINSFGIKNAQSSNNVTYAKLDNNTSMCFYYDQGWTKIYTYDNSTIIVNTTNAINSNSVIITNKVSSTNATCLDLVRKSYQSNMSQVLVGILKNDSKLARYQNGFVYTNSTTTGLLLSYSKLNLTATNLFQNDFGIFSSSIDKLHSPLSINGINFTCYGLIYNNTKTNTSICSYLIPAINYSVNLPYGFVNTTYVTSNYIFNLYSLVNSSSLVAAHENGAKLIEALGVNAISGQWLSPFKNECTLENDSLPCKFVSFNATTGNATANITNLFNSSIRINQINCELAGGFKNITVGNTINSNSTLTLAMHCNALNIPTSEIKNYMLIMNYTYNNRTRIANGYFNVS
ncbi:MAG: CARDB domain-containing protein [Candidatus Micrarchaeaceae archaeon]|jgi:hypothetical protein